ncbi:hypothetical protein F5879DRAFT_991305 [Lentinula edodes]|nr:hypothetical protein F5879DRAFT_991305 [Lentinula edodes]
MLDGSGEQSTEVEGGFEVFDSGGSWNFLFGKPLLEKFAAVHDYQKDSILLRGRKGNIREVFNEGLGAAIKGTSEEEDRDLPRPSAPVQAVLEESEGPLGGVIVKALTPLDREVENLFRIEWEHVANIDGQYLPRFEAPTRRQNPQIEEVPDEDLEHTHAGWHMPQEAPELPMSTTEEDWRRLEAGMEEWFKESRRIQREEAIKHQEALEQQQQELKEPVPPKRLSVNLPGGLNASPSREVSPDVTAAEGACIDPSFAEFSPHHADVNPTKTTFDMQDGVQGKNAAEFEPNGTCTDSVGGFNIPPSREVPKGSPPDDPHLADQTRTVPICMLQAKEYPNLSSLGPDFFPDALDQSDDSTMTTSRTTTTTQPTASSSSRPANPPRPGTPIDEDEDEILREALARVERVKARKAAEAAKKKAAEEAAAGKAEEERRKKEVAARASAARRKAAQEAR